MVVLSRLWTGAGQNRSNGVVKPGFVACQTIPLSTQPVVLKDAYLKIYKSWKGAFIENENTNIGMMTLTNAQIRPMVVLSRLWTGAGQIDPAVWLNLVLWHAKPSHFKTTSGLKKTYI